MSAETLIIAVLVLYVVLGAGLIRRAWKKRRKKPKLRIVSNNDDKGPK